MTTKTGPIAEKITVTYADNADVVVDWHSESFTLNASTSSLHHIAIRAAEKLVDSDDNILRLAANMQRDLEQAVHGVNSGLHVTTAFARRAAELDTAIEMRAERAAALRALLRSITN
jgi:hypothetical protein